MLTFPQRSVLNLLYTAYYRRSSNRTDVRANGNCTIAKTTLNRFKEFLTRFWGVLSNISVFFQILVYLTNANSEKPYKLGIRHYLVLIWNCAKLGVALIKTVLKGDSLFFRLHNKRKYFCSLTIMGCINLDDTFFGPNSK